MLFISDSLAMERIITLVSRVAIIISMTLLVSSRRSGKEGEGKVELLEC